MRPTAERLIDEILEAATPEEEYRDALWVAVSRLGPQLMAPPRSAVRAIALRRTNPEHRIDVLVELVRLAAPDELD